MREHFLLPGDLVTARGAAHFRTLLGSCVSICLTNRPRKLFGMTHYLLPTNPGGDEPGRYGDTSTHKLLKSLLLLDPEPKHYSARVFGGAAVVKQAQGVIRGIGECNIEVARELLSAYRIRVTEEDVGGEHGRKLDFWTAEDRVHCRLIKDQYKKPTHDTNRGSLRAVVVDDSATSRAVIRAALEAGGVRVVFEAASALKAREAVLNQQPDVLTLELNMPHIDGLTFLRQLTRHFPTPVVVVSSGVASGSERARQALAAGAQAVVDKAELDMASAAGNLEKLLVPRIKLAALSRIGTKRRMA